LGFREGDYDPADPRIVSAIDELPLWSAYFGMPLLEMVELRAGIDVLDIGSGSGFPSLELSQRLGSGCRIYCVDPWKQACGRLGEKADTLGAYNIKILNTGAETLPLPDSSIDLVVSNNGINNVDDERKVLEEAARVSRGGAQMLIAVNLPETMKEFYSVFRGILRERGMDEEMEKLDQHIFAKRKPLEYTINMISEAGFRVRDVRRGSFEMRYVNGTAMLNSFFIKFAFLPSWIEVVSGADTPGIFESIESRLNRQNEREGELKLTVPYACIDSERKS
jgi:ubiquinone/menaquinone biosynthesis C-methylase UbiE